MKVIIMVVIMVMAKKKESNIYCEMCIILMKAIVMRKWRKKCEEEIYFI